MRRFLATAITLTLIAPVFSTDCGLLQSAFAHGGSYRGPAGEVPTGSREPTDPPPPTDPEPPTTPGGAGDDGTGPSTDGDDRDPPETDDDGPGRGGDGNPPGAGGDGTGPVTSGPGGRRPGKAKGPGYEDWTFWWNYNKDEIVQLKSSVRKLQSGRRSGGIIHDIGQGARGGEQVVNAAAATVRNVVMPALRDLLAQDDLNFDIQSAAAIALAKIGDTDVIATLKRMARNERVGKRSGNYHAVVRESAGLSFGLLQEDTEEVRSFLINIIQDDQLDASRVRPFSAISLGLLGAKNDKDGAASNALLALASTRQKDQNLRPAALVALGLLGDPGVVEDLLYMVREGKALANGKSKRKSQRAAELSDVDLAFAVQALGKIGVAGLAKAGEETAVVDQMYKLLDLRRSNKTDRRVRYSAAIALGQLAPVCSAEKQSEILEQLRRIALAKKGVDSGERNFAMISIGRVGATKGIDPAARMKAVKILTVLLKKARPASISQPYAGIGLGLIGRALREEGLPTLADDINQPLREKFAKTRNPRARGAYAIASGLIGDKLAVKGLIETLEDSGNDGRLRGYCAVSLGLIGSHEARASIAKALTSETNRHLRVQTAVAAGLIGDAGVIAPLVEILESGEESQYVLGSVALSLGQIGDERSIAPLVRIAHDEADEFPDLTRALATVALGQIGDQRDVPVLSRVARDFNYRAYVEAFVELLSIL